MDLICLIEDNSR